MLAVALKPASTGGGGGSATTTIHYIHTDHLGSTHLVTDSTGAISEATDYYAYGAPRTDTKSSTYQGEQRKYIGQYYDASSQLSYLNARYYDLQRGQFLSEDPLINAIGGDTQKYGRTQFSLLISPQELNFYSYSQNNPVTKSDPAGLGDGTMGYFNNYYPNYPSSVVNIMQQVKYEAMSISVGLPFATLIGGGVMVQAVVAPEIAPAGGAAYQGAMVNVALRATDDVKAGTMSTPKQYFGDALFGAVTGRATEGRGLLSTLGISAASAAASSWNSGRIGAIKPSRIQYGRCRRRADDK